MPIEAPSIAAHILLLEANSAEVALLEKATPHNRLSVVSECAQILGFLQRQPPYEAAARPDLILLDLDLSKEQDCAMLAEIKKDPQFKRIPVVVMATSERTEDVFQAYDLHANAYICKPADPEELIRIVAATLHFWLALVRLPRA